jgi:hypothetical protein
LSRRVSMPRADDLFRPTVAPTEPPARSVSAVPAVDETEADTGPRKPSGRIRHDEKMTVYVTSDELMDLEHARLNLRRNHGLVADRGRVVREALALVLEDFEANGADSVLVRRLRES